MGKRVNDAPVKAEPAVCTCTHHPWATAVMFL